MVVTTFFGLCGFLVSASAIL